MSEVKPPTDVENSYNTVISILMHPQNSFFPFEQSREKVKKTE